MARSSFHYLKWNFVFEVQFTSVIRGHHIYKSVWTPTLGEKLNCREDDRKEAKQHDEYAIGTYLEAYTGSELVGHVPMELSYLIYTFLRAYDDNEVSAKVTRRVKKAGERTCCARNIQSADTKQGYCHEVWAGDFAAERTLRPHNPKRSLRVSWRGESHYEIRVNHEENERGWDGSYLESLISVHFLAYVGGLCFANPIFCSLANDVLSVCIVVASM